MTRALYGYRELSLVSCAGSRHPSGKDLSSFGDEFPKFYNVLVVDIVILAAECTDFLFSAHSAAGSSGSVRMIIILCKWHFSILPVK